MPTVLPSPDSNGYAPDDIDNEPYEIALVGHNTACPAVDTGGPITASGCIWEQISAPNGDTSDDMEFTQAPNTWYHVVLTACSDASDATIWGATDDQSSTLGCLDSIDRQSSGGNPGSFPITVMFPSTVTTPDVQPVPTDRVSVQVRQLRERNSGQFSGQTVRVKSVFSRR